MKPDLQFSVMCDEVRREDNGKLMLIGLFEIIGGLQYPMTYPGLAIVNRWNNGEGTFRQRVRIVDAENKTLVETPESPVQLPDMASSVTAVSLIQRLEVAKPGRYWVEVLLDSDLKQRYPLMAVQMPPPQGPPGSPWGPGPRP